MAKGKFSHPRRQGNDLPTQKIPRIPEPEELKPVDIEFPEDMPLYDPFYEEPVTEAAPEDDAPVEESQEEAIEHAFRQVTGQEEEYYEDDYDDEPRPGFFRQNGKIILVSVCVFLLIAIGGIIAFVFLSSAADPYDNLILNNVTVAGVNIGGLSRTEAERLVEATFSDRYGNNDMVVSLPEGTIYLSPEKTGARLDVSAAVKEAFDYGRTGTDAEREAAYNMSLSTNHTIGLLPYLNLDENYIRGELELYASQFGSTLSQTTYKLEGEMPVLDGKDFDPDAPCQNLVITMGTPGLGLDIGQLFNDILDAYSFNRFQVEVKEIAPEAIPDALDLEAIYQEFYIEPVNATVDMEKYEPIPGIYGYGFDLEEAQKLLDAADYGETITIPMEYIEPEILEDEVFFRDVLGECQTPHTTNEKRNVNLGIACKALDGLVLNPGEEFSFNDALGERTEERGYQPAPTYSGVKVVDSIGGGICQVSSTLYWCTLLADLEIVNRINHGMPVTYMDLGLDATVSWGYPDYQFKNNTNFPVKIHAEVADGYVKMQILGTDQRDYYVKMESTITSVEYPETIYEEHGPDEGYYDGEVIQSPSVGYITRSYKIKYSKETDEELSKDFEARSQYKKVDKIVVKIVDPNAPAATQPAETQPSETTPPTQPGETTPAEPTAPPAEATQPTEPPAETQAPTQAPTEAPAPTETQAPPSDNELPDDEL